MKLIIPALLSISIFFVTNFSAAFPDEDYQELRTSTSLQGHQDVEKYISPTAIKHILKALVGIENLVIWEYPGGAVLQGELLSPDDMRKVVQISTTMNGVINLCSLHPEALHLAAEHIRTFMKKNHIIGMNLAILGDSLLLTGTTSGDFDVKLIDRICTAHSIHLINGTRQAVADSRMVFFEVSFTEINRDAFEELGVKWPASTTFTDPSGIRIGSFEPAHNLEITINHLVHRGKARIISKPRLTCGSGQEASFQAGGELPIPKSDLEGRLTIAWKPYGIILQIAPTIDSGGIIHTRIRSEVSMVDQANAVDGIPGILTRRIDTHLSLTLGQTIVLSGLVHSDDAERITKIPLLGNIPILGEIFKSRSFQKKETEMVVFLCPLKTNTLEGGMEVKQVIEGTY